MAREHGRLTEIYTIDNMMSGWRLRLLRAGAALLIAFEFLYFLFDWCFSPPMPPAEIAMHLGAIAVAVILLGLTLWDESKSTFYALCFASLTAIYSLTLAICLGQNDPEPLFLTVLLSILGASALAPWPKRWQAGLGAVGLVAVLIQAMKHSPAELFDIDRPAGVLAAIILAHFTITMRERHRAELTHWMERLRNKRRILARALAQTASALAEREISQSRARESERALRRIFEACPDTITIKSVRDGRYIDVNHGFRVFGYSREEALGKTAEELGLWASPEQLHDFALRLQVHGQVHNMETLCRTRNGKIIPSLISAGTVEVGGEPCVVSFVRDITDIKRTEANLIAAREAVARELAELRHTEKNLRMTRAELNRQVRELKESRFLLLKEIADRERAQMRLHEKERTLRKILEASPDAMTIERLEDGRYIEVNKTFEATCFSREEALGRTALELNLWADPDAYAAYLRQLDSHGQVRNMEFEYRTRDGEVRPSLISSVVVELDGELCVISIARDISQFSQSRNELIAAREAALAASEAKSHFLSVMSHEIRTPMNAILGMADLLWETPLGAEQRRYLDTILSNGASLLKLVNNVLDLSKIESRRLILEHTDFDLIALAEDVIETMALGAHEKGLDLALRIAPGLPTALAGDPLRLRQILINLIGNAIKFTERGQVVLTIEAGDAGPAAQALHDGRAGEGADCGRQPLRFAISDTGIGIPAEKQGLIFSSFTQADSTITRKYGGSGLGLAIARRLVGLMNGSIALTSRPGAGSTFTVAVALDLQPQAGRATKTAAVPAALAGKRVLVADGSAATRAMLADLLEFAGMEVVLAASAAEASTAIVRARAEGRSFDACMVEVAMPDAARLMYATETTKPQAMVLMLTTRNLNAQLGQLQMSGLADGRDRRYLLKPVRRAELWGTLAALCAGEAGGAAYRNGSDHQLSPSSSARDALLRSPAPDATLVVRKPLRILLAEDSPDSRLLIEAYLKNTPYRLDAAEDGRAAVDKFATGHYDVILMDIEMPVMDGYEAIAEIRRLERADHRRPTPIIALTASAQDEVVHKSLKMGCEAHLMKPVKRSQVLEAIRKVVTGAAPEPSMSQAADGEAPASPPPIVIEVDADLSELVPGFLERKRADARAILAALDKGDTETIARLGHKMKGEGGSYGFDAITDLGRGLEEAAKGHDFSAARQLSTELTEFLGRVEIVFRPAED